MHTIQSPMLYNNEVYNSSGLRVCTNQVYAGVKFVVEGRAVLLTSFELERLVEELRKV